MRGISYVRTIVVAHGASEVILCRSIQANLRLPMEIISENGGSKSIQINGLNKFFNESCFSNHLNRLSKSQRVQFENGTLINTKIFTIMDTDDCSEKTLAEYKDRRIFSKCPY